MRSPDDEEELLKVENELDGAGSTEGTGKTGVLLLLMVNLTA